MNTYSQKIINKISNDNLINDLQNDFSDYEEIIEIDNDQLFDYINVAEYNMNQIPANLSISTMSVACGLGTKFKIDNIYKYMILDSDNIIAIKCKKGLRCLDGFKEKFKSTNKNSTKVFSNQNTIIVRVSDTRFINIKLFKNGSIQMSGCKEMSDANIAVNKLIAKLSEVFHVKNSDVLNEITFVDEPNSLTVLNPKIDLINTNFGVSYLINKDSLYGLLTGKNILCRLSEKHSCVNIKHKIGSDSEDIYVSIFVFQTGNIIITGGKKAEYVRDAYNFIVGFLNQNKTKIMKKDISKILSADDFKEILDLE
jgi:TATA-box binding protein (TBP) (component of TFIID and TFIIIB)